MNKIGSKGEILNELKPKLSLFQIPELLIFSVTEYLSEKENVISSITEEFENCNLIIRSSAKDEDGQQYARAGEYESVSGVPSSDSVGIVAAIETVIASYKREASQNYPDQFFVQRHLSDTLMSGVVFTHDLNTGAPYYVINYDDVSGLTNTVTSGGGEYSNRTLFIHRGSIDSVRSERFQSLINAVRELEFIIGNQFLDVEFAISKDFVPHLFQVRSITNKLNWDRAVLRGIDDALTGVQTFVRNRFQPMPNVYGKTTVLGQMPDWNPAEMIGRAPRALAYSLYKTLITDDAWRIARESMGYAVPAGYPLMVSLAGQPYIDTRLSFHSYIPAKLPGHIAEKLVDFWVHRLSENPQLHDKIEFEVAITTYSFDIDEKLRTLVGKVITNEECQKYKSIIQEHTHDLLKVTRDGSLAQALDKIHKLELSQKKKKKLNSNNNLSSLYKMLEDCIGLGTVPFAILARHAFIAKTILLSLCHRGILTKQDMECIQSSIRTVAGELVDDMHKMQVGNMKKDDFMAKYGHLRPGTYDILSRRYDQMADFSYGDQIFRSNNVKTEFKFSEKQRSEIDLLLKTEGFLNLNTDSLMDYVQAATAGREYGKFVFTRTVSNILELIASYGESHGLSREQMSHIPLDSLIKEMEQSGDACSVKDRLHSIVSREVERHAISVAIRLPQVLFDEAGVHVVPFQVSHPNFITQKKITAPVVSLSAEEDSSPTINGKIVLIENADPGFDWIFSQSIVGLITKYGGANSHMAIRCAEFGIAAAIGCGEQRYEAFLHANKISIDCAAGLISEVH